MTTDAESADVSFPPAANEMLQVIDYDENFNDALHAFLDSQDIISKGFDYHVASILGAQSSGKSTLLNLLFGTQFRTMDEASGRYQVTQGVWLGINSGSPILIFDLEGTDSRERGEGAANFERKIALFALALSEVLIVNIWAHDVGRMNAANLELLRTVMELDLQLFFGGGQPSDNSNDFNKRMHKTRLLFVLRDHVSSPFEKLCETLRYDVDKIWSQISKPEAASDIPLDSFFDLDFFSLPHKILMEQQFQQRGSELRRRFQEGDVFEEEYASGVAADGFPTYARSIWDTIRNNRELDIPTQKEMLAHVRCEQLARESLAKLEKEIDRFRENLFPADGGAPTIAEGAIEAVLPTADMVMSRYDAAAERYSKYIAVEKRTDLATRVMTTGRALFDAAVSAAAASAMDVLQKKLTEHLTSQSRAPWKGWATFKSTVQEKAALTFHSAAGMNSINALSDEHVLCGLRSVAAAAQRRLESHVSERLEEAELKIRAKGVAFLVEHFGNGFRPPVTAAIDSVGSSDINVWQNVSEAANVCWENSKSMALKMFSPDGMGLSADTVESIVNGELKESCYEVVLRTVRDVTGSGDAVLMRMIRRFDDKFRFDERGVPRHFGPSEDIETLFVSAREDAEAVVEMLKKMRLTGIFGHANGVECKSRDDADSDDSEDAGDIVKEVEVVNDAVVSELREKLRRQAGAVFLETKRSQEAARVTAKIPLWVIGLVIMLGWNEFVAVVRSPALLMLTIIILPAVYFGYILNAGTVLGPAVTAAAEPFIAQAKETIRQYVAEEQPVTAPVVPGINHSSNSTSPIALSTSVSSTSSNGLRSVDENGDVIRMKND